MMIFFFNKHVKKIIVLQGTVAACERLSPDVQGAILADAGLKAAEFFPSRLAAGRGPRTKLGKTGSTAEA
jgi:hypothetical protein